jgi:hypothetical protein
MLSIIKIADNNIIIVVLILILIHGTIIVTNNSMLNDIDGIQASYVLIIILRNILYTFVVLSPIFFMGLC